MTTNQNLIINGSINTGSRTISLEANNNLTIAADLITSNQTASAIRAIAGKNDAAGTATGAILSFLVPPQSLSEEHRVELHFSPEISPAQPASRE